MITPFETRVSQQCARAARVGARPSKQRVLTSWCVRTQLGETLFRTVIPTRSRPVGRDACRRAYRARLDLERAILALRNALTFENANRTPISGRVVIRTRTPYGHLITRVQLSHTTTSS